MYVVYATTVRPDIVTPFANNAPEFAEAMMLYNEFLETRKDLILNHHTDLSDDTLTQTDVYEFEDFNSQKLVALSTWLSDRAKDENARGQISQDAFIKAAKSLGVTVSSANLGEIISKEPLSNMLEPLEPNSGVVRFKGNTETTTDMDTDQAQDVVDKNAKTAMRRGMKSA